jgi:hypothetical protein
VIVRVSTEGQYELGEDDKTEFDELDHAAVATCQGEDEAAFHASFDKLLEFVRSHGKRVAGDDLRGSDVILPPPDVSIDEARAEFSGEGLIPG